MLRLPTVQLILLDGTHDPLAGRVLDYVTRRIEFGHVEHVRRRMTYDEAMEYQARRLGDHLPDHCTHQLSIECDGWPVHPDMWTDDFLSWDYIGAPWPPNIVRIPGASRVGNGGCALRSRRFIDAIRDIPRPAKMSGDVYWCQHPDTLAAVDAAGALFAPLETAMQWSMEEVIPEFRDWTHAQSFGFHRTLQGWRELLDTRVDTPERA